MTDFEELQGSAREARARFAAAVDAIRPDLHRYCSRMTGSVLDGEDLVQETLAQALYRLSLLGADVPLRPWLFTIAHHRCVDFLRGKRAAPTADLDEGSEPAVDIQPDIEQRDLASRAFSRLVLSLPPRQRAAVVLKEILGHSLPEIAAILETSVGAVKAALHRARETLAAAREDNGAPEPAHESSPAAAAYIEAFNRRDWGGLQSLLEEEVRCEVVGFVHHVGRAALSRDYLTTYAGLPYGWKLASGEVDGEPAIVCLCDDGGRWTARHAIRLEWRGERVARIRDYAHITYLLADARIAVGVPFDPTP